MGIPFEIGCADPRSQKRDLGHPSICNREGGSGSSRADVAFVEKCEKSELSELSPVTKGTIFLPTSQVLANVPSVIRRPCHLAWMAWAFRWCVSKLSKLLNQEDALSAPWLSQDFGFPQARPRGRRNPANRRNPSLRLSLYRLLHPSHHAGKGRCFPGG